MLPSIQNSTCQCMNLHEQKSVCWPPSVIGNPHDVRTLNRRTEKEVCGTVSSSGINNRVAADDSNNESFGTLCNRPDEVILSLHIHEGKLVMYQICSHPTTQGQGYIIAYLQHDSCHILRLLEHVTVIITI